VILGVFLAEPVKRRPIPMALDQSVLSEVLDAFRTGEGLDLIKEAAALRCQELIEVELTAQIGADRYERTSSRVNERNGHRPRVLSTKAGDELVSALGVSSGISKSEVSRICGQSDEVIDSFRERRLDHVAFPYVYLDATYLHV
jgi:putative transposase